jgi:hypothetical protein
MVNELMLCAGLDAGKTPGKGMLGVAHNACDFPIFDMDSDPAFTVRGLATGSDYFFQGVSFVS